MKAGINTGVLPCIFSMTTFYISVIFYYKLNEKISTTKIVGIILMIPCMTFISLGADVDKLPAQEDIEEDFTDA